MTHPEKLYEIYRRNLEVLVEQVSSLGFEYAPPHLINRIEDEIKHISEICKKQGFLLPGCVDGAYDILRRTNSTVVPQKGQGLQGSQPADQVCFDAFLSYSSCDAEEVRSLVRHLKDKGIRVWFDEEQIRLGDLVTLKVEEGLRRSTYVLACLTTNFLESKWCRAEYGSMLNREITKGETRVIPVVLGDFDADCLFPLLYDKQRVDVRTPDGFQRLVQIIKEGGY